MALVVFFWCGLCPCGKSCCACCVCGISYVAFCVGYVLAVLVVLLVCRSCHVAQDVCCACHVCGINSVVFGVGCPCGISCIVCWVGHVMWRKMFVVHGVSVALAVLFLV